MYLGNKLNPVIGAVYSVGITTAVKLGKVIGTSDKTAKRRIENPGELTLAELKRLRTHGHIEKEVLIEAIRKEI